MVAIEGPLCFTFSASEHTYTFISTMKWTHIHCTFFSHWKRLLTFNHNKYNPNPNHHPNTLNLTKKKSQPQYLLVHHVATSILTQDGRWVSTCDWVNRFYHAHKNGVVLLKLRRNHFKWPVSSPVIFYILSSVDKSHEKNKSNDALVHLSMISHFPTLFQHWAPSTVRNWRYKSSKMAQLYIIIFK